MNRKAKNNLQKLMLPTVSCNMLCAAWFWIIAVSLSHTDPLTNRVSGIESSNNTVHPIAVNSQSSCPSRTECLPINRTVVSTGSTGISSQTVTASCTLLRSDDRGGCSSSGLGPKTWTRLIRVCYNHCFKIMLWKQKFYYAASCMLWIPNDCWILLPQYWYYCFQRRRSLLATSLSSNEWQPW